MVWHCKPLGMRWTRNVARRFRLTGWLVSGKVGFRNSDKKGGLKQFFVVVWDFNPGLFFQGEFFFWKVLSTCSSTLFLLFSYYFIFFLYICLPSRNAIITTRVTQHEKIQFISMKRPIFFGGISLQHIFISPLLPSKLRWSLGFLRCNPEVLNLLALGSGLSRRHKLCPCGPFSIRKGRGAWPV